jgi:sigma-B regulation protein RsbU (phosphoserine phosphatase)
VNAVIPLHATIPTIPHHPRTLIADDEPDILAALRLLLKGEGYEPLTVSSPAAVLEAIQHSQFDVVLIDLNYARDTTSGREGMDLISRIHALDPSLPIVVMTAWGTVDLAVQAMRRGVCDFVQKPWDNRHLLQTLAKQVKHAQARRSFQNKMAIDRQRDTRLQREFVEARELQESLLTTSAPSLPAFELAMHWQPATTVGGDYVSAFKIDDNRVALCVADVVGKGLPAALLMSNFQAALKSLAGSNLSSSEVATRLNQQLYANTPLHKFVTAFYGVLDVSSRRLQFTNAGHNPPILLRANGEWRRLEAGGTVLGGFEAASFSEDIVDLRAGDRLLLFTDGLTEAVDESGEQFGEARLIQLLSQYRNCNAEQVKEIVFTAVANFCDDTFADDAALMVVAVS